MFIGNSKNVIFFEKALQNGRLSHAYCFCGPEGVGKFTLAKKIASEILQTPEDKLLQNPNFYYFERSIDEKTGKAKKEITVSQAREIKEKMTRKAWGERGQVLIVDGAQYLNEESGNALLKALEEPAQNSYLFLLGDHEKNILPTILSRCQKVFFHPVGNLELLEGLKKNGYDEKNSEMAVLLANGLPGKAKKLAEDKEFVEEFRTEIRKWLSLLKTDFFGKTESLENIFSDKDGNKARDILIKKTDFWLELWRELLLFKTKKRNSRLLTEAEMILLPYTAKQISEIMDELIKTQNYLKNNVQIRLAVEQFLLKF
ncbi:MAG TPA: AAA family ATPase [Candidatus Magasanikbacteria bacterium]|nr:AAA family ATPase [Candidatus Magasanikbacteria bacterium]